MSNARNTGGDGDHDPQEEERFADETKSADDSSPSNEQLLENVLRATSSSDPGTGFLKVITQFAERNRTRKITEPDVAEALVDEFLRKRFDKVSLPPECAEFVASSLLDDPDARDRLKRLWAQALGEANAL